MKKKPKFSIIIPVYNVEKYLNECINSVLSQDFNDYELICVNDGSTDSSLDILLSFDDERIKIINQGNQGQSNARNLAIESSSGEYIWFVDSDDKIADNSLRLIDNLTKKKNYGIVFFNATVFFDSPELEKKGWHSYMRSTYGEMESLSFFEKETKNKNTIVSPCCYIFKKELSNDIRFIPYIYHEDNDFFIKLIFNNKSSLCYVLDSNLFIRRVRSGSVMTSRKSMKHLIGYSTCIDEISKYKKIKKIENKYLDIFLSSLIIALFNTSREINDKEAKSYVEKYKNRIELSFKNKIQINFPIIKLAYSFLKKIGKITPSSK